MLSAHFAIGFVDDDEETGLDSEGESGVEEPVVGGGKRDGHDEDLEGEDFGGVGPEYGANDDDELKNDVRT